MIFSCTYFWQALPIPNRKVSVTKETWNRSIIHVSNYRKLIRHQSSVRLILDIWCFLVPLPSKDVFTKFPTNPVILYPHSDVVMSQHHHPVAKQECYHQHFVHKELRRVGKAKKRKSFKSRHLLATFYLGTLIRVRYDPLSMV